MCHRSVVTDGIIRSGIVDIEKQQIVGVKVVKTEIDMLRINWRVPESVTIDTGGAEDGLV